MHPVVIEIDRDELATRIVEAIIFPDKLIRTGTATETLDRLQNGQATSARNAAEAAIVYLNQQLNNGHTQH